ncbi:hypothetical protein RNZ50_20275 [Paracoccaceae bacterium Fryx2]|nr:hypothetical protein [Paracoccaceae bacterium Fryx2]
MLLVWPLVAMVLYQRLSPARALIWTVLGGYLLLPPLAAIDLPMVPDLDKASIPNLAALVLALFLLRDRISFLPQSWAGRLLIGLFVLSPFATVLTNGDPVPIVAGDLPGLRIYDSVAAVANQAIALLPFFLARRYLGTPEAMRAIVVALVVAGLAYSVPMLIETRLSPQMNVWVYGYFQHDFFQTIRFGGYRPVVFLPHGLWAAFFALMAFASALILFRIGPAEDRPRLAAAALYLGVVLVACKSFGPFAYALALAPVILLLGQRVQLLLAAALALVVITYPLLRGAHLVPLDGILAVASDLSPERASSLAFRIGNEELLLDRANLRPLFGWGGYGRNLILDPVSGQARTIADGSWIIVLGLRGWLGYIAEFGLLVLPLLLLGREALVQRRAAFSPFLAVVALIFAANLLDLLPNATLIPFTWLMAGGLLGHAEALAAARRAAGVPMPARPSRTIL